MQPLKDGKYDALNPLTKLVDAAGTTAYTYSTSGDLLTEDGPWSSDTVTYTYHSSVPHLRKALTVQRRLTRAESRRFVTITCARPP